MSESKPQDHTPHTLIEADTAAFLGERFPALSGRGFEVPEGLTEMRSADETLTTLPWRWTGRHTTRFEGVNPTGRTVVIDGSTIMRYGDDGPQFRRYIDWLLVYAQIGVVLSRAVQVAKVPLVINDREIPSVDEMMGSEAASD